MNARQCHNGIRTTQPLLFPYSLLTTVLENSFILSIEAANTRDPLGVIDQLRRIQRTDSGPIRTVMCLIPRQIRVAVEQHLCSVRTDVHAARRAQ